jgi:hypothetical protein
LRRHSGSTYAGDSTDGRATFAIVLAAGDPLTFANVGTAPAHATALQPGGRVGVAAGREPDAPHITAGRAAAASGQVLVSDPARWGEHDGRAFRDAGPRDLGAGRAPAHARELL